VAAGARGQARIPVARITTGEWTYLTVEVLHGARPGPALWLSGAIHGDELDGVEIIRRTVEHLDPGRMAGTVLAVPIVNVFGFQAEDRYLPDRRDLNRSFPGSNRGSTAAQLAHLFMKEIVSRCAYGIDFHCGSDGRENLPQVRGDLKDEETLALARAFGAPMVIHGRPPDGSLRKAAVKRRVRVLLYEGGEAGRFTPEAIEAGVLGTLRVLHALDIMAGPAETPPAGLESWATRWVRAPRSGICRLDIGLGEMVRKGQRLGVVGDAAGRASSPVRARVPGVVIGRRVRPPVYQGQAIIHLAEIRPETRP
jgi:hypothetical protein